MPSTPNKLTIPRSSNGRKLFGKKKCTENDIQASQPLRELKNGQPKGDIAGIFTDFLNFGADDQMEIRGFVKDRFRTAATWFFIILTLGSLRLVFHWWSHWMLFATHRRCSLDVAEKVLIIESYQQKHKCYYVKTVKVITAQLARELLQDDENIWDQHLLFEMDDLDDSKLSVHISGGVFKEMDEVRTFNCKKITYVWDYDDCKFHKLRGLDWDVTASALHLSKGLTASQQYFRRAVFGPNEIIVPLRSVVALLFLEVLNPFYIFQIFSFILWFVDDYILYALAIGAMSCASIVVAVVQTRRNQLNLSNRVHSSDLAEVLRVGASGESEKVMISTDHLVPGDVLVLPSHGYIMHCDAVLLNGNCIVNESMLTGESVPVTKTPMPNSPDLLYNEKEHARHTLFCGTQVIQTRFYGNERVHAVVIRTSFSTAKGNLVRSILYPPPVDFKFEQDSYRFVQLLALVAVFGVFYTVVSKSLRGNPMGSIILEALDLVTIVVPPALPAAMTVGRMYAQSRLEKAKIFCISPRTINVSGSVNCVCFDKTGTLTEDGLDMWGVVPVYASKFQKPVKNVKNHRADHLLRAMVTCHSITRIDGNLAGDPLDIKMFESTGWELEEPAVSDETKFDLISPTVVKPSQSTISEDGIDLEVGIIRQFPFSSTLQRMSVITRQLGAKSFILYSKGSPEMILSLCAQNTVPPDFDAELEGFTKEGYRVLGVAYKELPSKLSYAKMQRLSREDAECGLTFLGLIIMENRLKPQTSDVLSMLMNAKIRTIMVTGDNMLTALSVARDCGIIPADQRVIMVNSNTLSSGKTEVYFTQSKPVASPDTAHIMSEMSQLTATESLTSLQTIASLPMQNGNIRNSAIPELPLDNCIVESGLFSTDYSFSLTGSTWTALRSHHPDLMLKVVTRGAVFARMSPDHKQQLVQELQTLDYYVAMVGDGANDCGALKAAHAGISLSEAESSVASPFTSKDPNISCIVQVIREGRAALVTSFAIFKYMAAYSLMQFASVVILYSIDLNLTDMEYLYIDLFDISVFAFVLGRVEPYSGPLYSEPPQTSLISFTPILSLIGQVILAVTVQFISFAFAEMYSEDPPGPVNITGVFNATDTGVGFENYAIFTVSSLQYIILAIVFSKGAPYRKPLIRTPSLMFATTTVSMFTLYIIIYPSSFLVYYFEMSLPKSIHFRFFMVLLGLFNLVVAVFYELFCDYVQRRLSRSKRRKLLKYEELEKFMKNNFSWPPISSESPPVEVSPKLPRQPPTVTVVNSPPGKKSLSSIGITNSGSDLNMDDLKFSTPMRSVHSLLNHKSVGQSEDSLSGYLTPPTSLNSSSQNTPIRLFHPNS